MAKLLVFSYLAPQIIWLKITSSVLKKNIYFLELIFFFEQRKYIYFEAILLFWFLHENGNRNSVAPLELHCQNRLFLQIGHDFLVASFFFSSIIPDGTGWQMRRFQQGTPRSNAEKLCKKTCLWHCQPAPRQELQSCHPVVLD